MKFNNLFFESYKDQFNYYNLIQKINPGYRLFFNKRDKKFAIVNIFRNNEICKTFNSFYGNILQDLRFFKIENFNNILKNIDLHNEKLTLNNNQKCHDLNNNLIHETEVLLNRSNHIEHNDINKIIGATKC